VHSYEKSFSFRRPSAPGSNSSRNNSINQWAFFLEDRNLFKFADKRNLCEYPKKAAKARYTQVSSFFSKSKSLQNEYFRCD
jgi:hypothetical protein